MTKNNKFDLVLPVNGIVTKEYLDNNSNVIFVFGDNTIGIGYGGAAVLRDHVQSYGLITKVYPDNADSSYYTVKEYKPIFEREMTLLKQFIQQNKNKLFLISKLGAGLANKYKIYENIIYPELVKLENEYDNVIFLKD